MNASLPKDLLVPASKRIFSGQTLEFKFHDGLSEERAAEIDFQQVSLAYLSSNDEGGTKIETVDLTDRSARSNNGKALVIQTKDPVITDQAWGNLFDAPDMSICFYYKDSKNPDPEPVPQAVSNATFPVCPSKQGLHVTRVTVEASARSRGVAIAALVVLLVTLFVKLAMKDRKKGPVVDFRLASFLPLELAVTESGRLSLARTQLLIWTYVLTFGLVYVWAVSEGFLPITDQVL